MKKSDKMFKNLTSFGYQRSITEAVGFYLAYLLLLMIAAGGLAIMLAAAMGQSDNFNFGLIVGNILAIIASSGISFMILKEKKLLSNYGFILLALLAGVLAFFIGALGGLIPAAFLTTRTAGGELNDF